MIKGKAGAVPRETCWGKRVDYSARLGHRGGGPNSSSISAACPKKIALELYQPFIIRKLKEHGLADTIKVRQAHARAARTRAVWDILEEVIYQHPVLLNPRSPRSTGWVIQAFEPVLVEGNAIRIHPLVCGGFNADFDGDQMAVHPAPQRGGPGRGPRADAQHAQHLLPGQTASRSSRRARTS